MDVGTFVQMVKNSQGVFISAPEEIAFHEKWITKEELLASAGFTGNLLMESTCRESLITGWYMKGDSCIIQI